MRRADMSRIAVRRLFHASIACAALAVAAIPVAAQPWGPSRQGGWGGPGMMGQCWQTDGSWNQQACPWHPGGPGMPGPGMMGPNGWGPGGWGPGGWGQGSSGQGGWGQGGWGMMGRGMMGRGMGAVDTNGDGAIAADEAAAMAEAAFDRLDQDQDDRLTREEVLGATRGAPGPMAARMEARFKAMDRNNDGVVDHDEWMAWHQERFQAADANKDGKVSTWEFRAAMRRP